MTFFGKKLAKNENFLGTNGLIKHQNLEKVPKIRYEYGIWSYFMLKTSKMTKLRISRSWFNPFVPIRGITA